MRAIAIAALLLVAWPATSSVAAESLEPTIELNGRGDPGMRVGRFIVAFDDDRSIDNESAHDRALELVARTELELAPIFGHGAPDVVDVSFARYTDGFWPPDDPRWDDPFLDVKERFADRVAAQVVFDLGRPEMQMRAPESYGNRGPYLGWVLMHEGVHALLGEAFVRNAPAWVREGAAEYFSGSPKRRVRKAYPDDDDLNRGIAARESDAYGVAHERIEKLIERCGEYAVAEWLIDLRSDAKAALGDRVRCDPAHVASWRVRVAEAPMHGTQAELAELLTLYRTKRALYDDPVAIELMPIEITAALSSSSADVVLEKALWTTHLRRQDTLDLLIAGLMPNSMHARNDRRRRFTLLENVFSRTGYLVAADMLAHGITHGDAVSPSGDIPSDALQQLPRSVRAFWMGDRLVRAGKHADAEPYFEESVISGFPDVERARFSWAVAACRSEHFDVCLREMDKVHLEPFYYARVTSDYPHEATREWWRAKALLRLGRPEEARLAFRDAIVRFDLLDPEKPDPFGPIEEDMRDVLCESGLAFARERRWKEANLLFSRGSCVAEQSRAFAEQEMWFDVLVTLRNVHTPADVWDESRAIEKLGLPVLALRNLRKSYARLCDDAEPRQGCDAMLALQEALEANDVQPLVQESPEDEVLLAAISAAFQGRAALGAPDLPPARDVVVVTNRPVFRARLLPVRTFLEEIFVLADEKCERVFVLAGNERTLVWKERDGSWTTFRY